MVLVLIVAAHDATKVHVITFGKWVTVKWLAGPEEAQPVGLKVRPLSVDGRAKEFALGVAHDVRDRLFVTRRAFRLNDGLPEEANLTSHWRWNVADGFWQIVSPAIFRRPVYPSLIPITRLPVSIETMFPTAESPMEERNCT